MTTGRLVTTTVAHDGGRTARAWLPDRPAEAAILTGDAELVVGWGAELNAAQRLPVAILGLDRAGDEQTRLQEYSPAFDPDRFAGHERAFLAGLSDWADELAVPLMPERTAVAGVSAGAEFALALAVRHRERFSALYCASPGGGFTPADDLGPNLPRGWFVSGTQEPWFGENTDRWGQAWARSGGQVERRVCPGDHGDRFWAEQLVPMVTWAFDR